MKVKIKAKVVSDPCIFRASCAGACDWCETHSYSEACVPLLQKRADELTAENKTKEAQLIAEREATRIVHKRLSHLLKSELIRSFDSKKRSDGHYARNIAEADRQYLAAHKVLQRATSCNDCELKKSCLFAPAWGESVRYNCPHYKGEG